MRILITGASGMVGEGVLLECLNAKDLEEVVVLGRKPCGHQHPKLREILHADFMNLEPIAAELEGFDACFFCLGISSIGVSAEAYRRVTHDLTLELARRLARTSPKLTFCYVTGMGTDATKRGWAQVKGETENELLRLFKNGYMFRPGAMSAVPGQKNLKLAYKLFAPLLPLMKRVTPSFVCTLGEVGRAMMTCARVHPANHFVEVRDIKALAITPAKS